MCLICSLYQKEKMTKAEARRAAYESMLVEPDEHINLFLRGLDEEESKPYIAPDVPY